MPKIDLKDTCFHKVFARFLFLFHIICKFGFNFRDCLLIYGGTGNPFGSVTSTAIHACNVNTGKFTKLNTLPSQGNSYQLSLS